MQPPIKTFSLFMFWAFVLSCILICEGLTQANHDTHNRVLSVFCSFSGAEWDRITQRAVADQRLPAGRWNPDVVSAAFLCAGVSFSHCLVLLSRCSSLRSLMHACTHTNRAPHVPVSKRASAFSLLSNCLAPHPPAKIP